MVGFRTMQKVRNGRSRRRGRPLRWTLLGAVLAAVVLAAVYAWQARSAYVHLTAAQARIPDLREQVVAGDQPAARDTAAAFADDTSRARTAVAGPHWSALTALPWVGPHVDAVRTVTESVDDLAADALPALLEAAEGVGPANLAPRDGRVPLAPIRHAAPHVRTAHREVAAAAERVGGIDAGALHERLQGPVTALATTLEDLRGQTATAVRAVDLLPPMLGAEGPRRYLLIAQNNAELRALGGMPGAAVLVRADRGRIRLVRHLTAGEAGVFEEPVEPLTEPERTLYGTQLGRYFSNVTSTPHFPRAARLARTMVSRSVGLRVDGVVAIDPYTLQLLLRANGPVDLPGGPRLTGRNTADVLLNRVYERLPDPEAQNDFFASAAAAAFDDIVSGPDLRATATALADATEQGRLLVWSADRAEQRVIARTRLGGLLEGDREGSPVVGVFLHDLSVAKINYFLHTATVLRPRCGDGDGPDLTARVVLRSQVPRGGGAAMSPSVVGPKVPPGHMLVEVLVYAPTGGLVTETRTSRSENQITSHRHRGLHAVARVVPIRPGGTVTLDYELSVPDSLVGPPVLRATPGVTAAHTRTRALRCP